MLHSVVARRSRTDPKLDDRPKNVIPIAVTDTDMSDEIGVLVIDAGNRCVWRSTELGVDF